MRTVVPSSPAPISEAGERIAHASALVRHLVRPSHKHNNASLQAITESDHG